MIEVKSEGTISSVVEDTLCTGCGTCVALCPNEAIEMVIDEKKGIYVPELDGRKCNNCGICFKVCPGHEVDFKGLNLEIFGKEPEDILIGNYLNCYIGHATDYDIRYNSASGGLVTALLIYMLEGGLIDGALVTRTKKDKPLEPEPFIARTREEIIGARGSKYCPVPANIMMREILEAEEGERFAVVGLPCHIHGIRKAEQVNKKLQDKIVFHLGIFCGHTPTLLGTEFIIKKILCITTNHVNKMYYRGDGWPGGILAELKDNTKKFAPHHYIWGNIFSQFFYPLRCTLCCDQTAELADISFGDAWLPELMGNTNGFSVIVSRTKVGDNILQKMAHVQTINLCKSTIDKVKQSQYGLLLRKNLKTRLQFHSFLKHKIPLYNKKLPNPSAPYLLKCIWFYFDIYISSKRYFWTLLSYYISVRSYIGKIAMCFKKYKI